MLGNCTKLKEKSRETLQMFWRLIMNKKFDFDVAGKRTVVNESERNQKVVQTMQCCSYDYMDVVLADFGEIQNDCLIHKVRPAIVISSTGYNTNSPVMLSDGTLWEVHTAL